MAISIRKELQVGSCWLADLESYLFSVYSVTFLPLAMQTELLPSLERLAGDRGLAGGPVSGEQVDEELHFEGGEKRIPFPALTTLLPPPPPERCVVASNDTEHSPAARYQHAPLCRSGLAERPALSVCLSVLHGRRGALRPQAAALARSSRELARKWLLVLLVLHL